MNLRAGWCFSFHLARPAVQITLRLVYMVGTYIVNYLFQSHDFPWLTQLSMYLTFTLSLHLIWFSPGPAQITVHTIDQKSRQIPNGFNCRAAREDRCLNLSFFFFLMPFTKGQRFVFYGE